MKFIQYKEIRDQFDNWPEMGEDEILNEYPEYVHCEHVCGGYMLFSSIEEFDIWNEQL